MFTTVESPTGHFTLIRFPEDFHELPNPFGSGGLLILNRFANNSAQLQSEHKRGLLIAASQARETFGAGNGALEVYGTTDRSGSESLNKALSTRRAEAALATLRDAMALSPSSFTFANGLGERFADEYFAQGEDSRNDVFRGVLCYLWESFSTATDAVLRINVAFAAPPLEGDGRRRIFLAALHMGRLRAQPPSPFR
jgi:OmpA family